jgi:hypothetical protein
MIIRVIGHGFNQHDTHVTPVYDVTSHSVAVATDNIRGLSAVLIKLEVTCERPQDFDELADALPIFREALVGRR